ncbi:MAG TPA: hypothetical protein VFC53_01525 [Dehalococcoidia bacterium]|nr:hypothetical protein [Dehalococcoidia bacterium]
MGDLRRQEGAIYHETERGSERIYLDACGRPLEVCVHGEEPAVVIEPESGQLVMELGGVAVSMPPEMAAKWCDEITRLLGPATEEKLRTEYVKKRDAYREQLAQERAAIEAEAAQRRAELTDLLRAIEEQRAEQARITAENREVQRGGAAG